MGNFVYSIGKVWQTFDSLSDARKHMALIIKQDKMTDCLHKDNNGYFIKRIDLRSLRTRRYPFN